MCPFMDALLKQGCDRQSIILNLGGGVIGDMGGFVASTYMRGIPFIQIPTTLLAQVDASIGDKLGIDFGIYKNTIGLFKSPSLVWINTDYLKTLNKRQINSGFAEIIKHALIDSEDLWHTITNKEFSLTSDLADIIINSLSVKHKIVSMDPLEKDIRKVLNFGHTIGHAVESVFLNSASPLLHGECVAIGMVCESYLSYRKGWLKANELLKIKNFIKDHFKLEVDLEPLKKDILDLLKKDKKVINGQIGFSLIDKIGHCVYNQEVREEHIIDALAYWTQ